MKEKIDTLTIQWLKNKRIELTTKDYRELRKTAYVLALGSCERCERYTPLSDGHFHHIVTRGAGGNDAIENGQWLCPRCHNKIHTGPRDG